MVGFLLDWLTIINENAVTWIFILQSIIQITEFLI